MKLIGAHGHDACHRGSPRRAVIVIVAAQDANAAVSFVSTQFELGVAQALTATSNDFATVTSGSGKQQMDLIRDDEVTADIATDFTWEGYAGADTVNRILAGQKPEPEGVGFRLMDRPHGLSFTGAYQYAAINYRAAYEKVGGR